MNPDNPTKELNERAQALFERFLAGQEGGEALELEELLGPEPPEIAQRVRAWAALMEELAPQLERELGPPLRSREIGLRIEAELGRGGMGVVYKVWDEELERWLAMKRQADNLGLHARQRFLNEARIMARLQHPGIVPVHRLGSDQAGAAWFTMDQVQGSTLEEWIAKLHLNAAGPGPNPCGKRRSVPLWSNQERFPENAAGFSVQRGVAVLLRVAEAIAFAHSRGVVHRDLKSSNVMVGQFGETYVLDWGLAVALGGAEESEFENSSVDASSQRLTHVGDVLGTPAYMAPELARGQARVADEKVDIYALGCLLYELLCSKPPYVHGADENSLTSAELLQALRQGPPAELERIAPGAPRELVAIAGRAMQREPGARYASMLDLAADLRAYTEGRVVGAFEAGVVAEVRKWIRRNPALTWLWASLFVAVVGGSAALGLVRHNERWRSQRYQDLQSVQGAEVQARENLWPITPQLVPNLEEWLGQAEALIQRLPRYQRELQRLEVLEENGTADLVKLKDLRELVQQVGSFAGPDGALERVRRRLDQARRIAQETLEKPRPNWLAAGGRVAKDPRFAGLKLVPQLGLVPLGSDAHSGLEEFAVFGSGTLPGRDAAGILELPSDAAIVLVLLPGGVFEMGSVGDPLAIFDDMPVHPVELGPFLIAKFELTWAQFRALEGPRTEDLADMPDGPRLPATYLDWFQFRQVLGHVGLDLPTEAQWEYAATAGLSTRFWWGDEVDVLFEHEVLDADGPAQVGSRDDNPFGLFDMLGNVSEWCLDKGETAYTEPVRVPSGLREQTDAGRLDQRSKRGGGYQIGNSVDALTAQGLARPRTRIWASPYDRKAHIGARCAKALQF